ncbi:MAG: ribosome biogenesis GTP-binding protein YihA/YsxC [Myxococcota bacterium]
MEAELAHDAGSAADFPRDGLPEVAFAGRSNVGKSSLINQLLGRRRLARTSTAPGKTRRIHFYRIAGRAYLVDLPGYGYARVAQSERRTWRPLVESYLRGERETLRGCLVLVDARRGPEEGEEELLEWLSAETIPARLLLTKSDKLPRGERVRCASELRMRLKPRGVEVAAVSSRTGEGIAQPAGWIAEWTGLALHRADGSGFSA